jgi:curli biogenesis system outer membrane secretion channel CsgG
MVKPPFSFCIQFLGALAIGGTLASSAPCQSSPIPFDEALAPPAAAVAPSSETSGTGARALSGGKPTVMVMGFESGTVNAQAHEKRGLRGLFGRGESEHYDAAQLGNGIADMLVEKLLETHQFRVLERRPQQPGAGAQFIVTGSVTKFGFEENNFGGIAASMATMGLLSYKQHKTEVTLTARVINAATGEIVASMSGEGLSRKGGGLRVGGLGTHGFGGVDVSSSNFRATAIGEATERAVSNLVEKIAQLQMSF